MAKANAALGQEALDVLGADDVMPVSFAGPKANLNSRERRALELAKKMEKQGRSREEIWSETGKLGAPWWKDEQGQWWMEFSDDKAKLKGKPKYYAEPPDAYDYSTHTYKKRPDIEAWANPNTTLGEIYDHPEYHRLYPKAKNLPARVGDLQGMTGFYTPKRSGEKPRLSLDPYEKYDEEDKRTGPYDLAANAERKTGGNNLIDLVVHEGQHFIQDEEDSFPNDPDHFPGEGTPVEIHAALAEIRRKYTMADRLRIPPWKMVDEAKRWYESRHDRGDDLENER
jgi:hypothetical protein